MKKLILICAVFMLSFSTSYAAMKCVPDSSGGMCCWDTDVDGPWKPISCM